MLYRLRGRGGATDYVAGTVVSSGGAASRPLDVSGAVFEPLSSWKSPAGGAVYPVTWRVRLPAEGLELESRTPVPQQEVRTGDAAFTYWEGLVDYAGNWNGEAVTGEGYVEMTGYEAPLELP
jgi:predicted secreted hydrolase